MSLRPYGHVRPSTMSTCASSSRRLARQCRDKSTVAPRVGALALSFMLSACGASHSPRDELEAFSREHPEVLIVVPASVPDGYRWAGIGEVQGDGRRDWAATLQFVSDDGLPLVETCAKFESQAEGCEPDSDVVINRTADQASVVVSIEGDSVGDAALGKSKWERVEFTSDLDSVPWIS